MTITLTHRIRRIAVVASACVAFAGIASTALPGADGVTNRAPAAVPASQATTAWLVNRR